MDRYLDSIDHEALFLVFLDLRKAYDTLDRGLFLQTPEGYGAGPKTHGILVELWENQWVVTRQSGHHGPQFWATRGTTKWGFPFTILFNVDFDSVVRHWILMTVEYGYVLHGRLGHTMGCSLGVFYADDKLLGSL